MGEYYGRQRVLGNITYSGKTKRYTKTLHDNKTQDRKRIDLAYQNKYLGTRSLIELIALLKKEYDLKELTTTYIWGNDHARHVYKTVGFTETDVVDEPGCHEVNMIYRFR